jgi:hypothetical protein
MVLTVQKTSSFAMIIIIVMTLAAMAGIFGIGATTTSTITAYAQTSQEQPPITSNDECLPGSVVHCIDDDHNNLEDLFELDVDELLALDADDLLERFGHND